MCVYLPWFRDAIGHMLHALAYQRWAIECVHLVFLVFLHS